MDKSKILAKISALPSEFDIEIGRRGGRIKADYKILKTSNRISEVAFLIKSDIENAEVSTVNYFRALSTAIDDGFSDDHLYYFLILDCD